MFDVRPYIGKRGSHACHAVSKSKKFEKHVISLWGDLVDSISSIMEQRLCYHDFNQLMTVVQVKL